MVALKKLTQLCSLVLLCAAAAQAQQKDTRQMPVQVVSGCAAVLGLKTTLGAFQVGSLRRLPLGAGVAAVGLFGLVYPALVLKKADACHDIGCEVYYENRIRRFGAQSAPADVAQYAFYLGKNKVQGNKVPQWIKDLQKRQ